jgi:hypothetical protein
MASLHNFHKNKHPGYFEGVGNKIKFAAEVAGSVKTIFDIGKGIYSAVSSLAPIAAALI